MTKERKESQCNLACLLAVFLDTAAFASAKSPTRNDSWENALRLGANVENYDIKQTDREQDNEFSTLVGQAVIVEINLYAKIQPKKSRSSKVGKLRLFDEQGICLFFFGDFKLDR